MNNMITKKTWDDFRATGLLFFINQVLHAFGWAIVVEVEDGKVKNCYPARVKFRGFDEQTQSEEHLKIGEYLKNNASELAEETKL